MSTRSSYPDLLGQLQFPIKPRQPKGIKQIPPRANSCEGSPPTNRDPPPGQNPLSDGGNGDRPTIGRYPITPREGQQSRGSYDRSQERGAYKKISETTRELLGVIPQIPKRGERGGDVAHDTPSANIPESAPKISEQQRNRGLCERMEPLESQGGNIEKEKRKERKGKGKIFPQQKKLLRSSEVETSNESGQDFTRNIRRHGLDTSLVTCFNLLNNNLVLLDENLAIQNNNTLTMYQNSVAATVEEFIHYLEEQEITSLSERFNCQEELLNRISNSINSENMEEKLPLVASNREHIISVLQEEIILQKNNIIQEFKQELAENSFEKHIKDLQEFKTSITESMQQFNKEVKS